MNSNIQKLQYFTIRGMVVAVTMIFGTGNVANSFAQPAVLDANNKSSRQIGTDAQRPAQIRPNSPELRALIDSTRIKDPAHTKTSIDSKQSLQSPPEKEGRSAIYLEQKMPIIRHPTRTGTPVEGTPELTTLKGNAAKIRGGYDIDLETGATTFPELAPCNQSEVRRVQVFTYSPMADLLDLTFYDATRSSEVEQAKKLVNHKLVTRGVGYVGGTQLKPTEIDPWQKFGMTLGLYCLPTRARFVTVGGERFHEFRTGAEAWIQTKDDFDNLEFLKSRKQASNPGKK